MFNKLPERWCAWPSCMFLASFASRVSCISRRTFQKWSSSYMLCVGICLRKTARKSVSAKSAQNCSIKVAKTGRGMPNFDRCSRWYIRDLRRGSSTISTGDCVSQIIVVIFIRVISSMDFFFFFSRAVFQQCSEQVLKPRKKQTIHQNPYRANYYGGT